MRQSFIQRQHGRAAGRHSDGRPESRVSLVMSSEIFKGSGGLWFFSDLVCGQPGDF